MSLFRWIWSVIVRQFPEGVTRRQNRMRSSADGVFGAQRVDHGTNVLIRRAPVPAACTRAIDVGTGYGPIAVAMGLREPSAGMWAVDVNRRALALARRNAEAAGARNVVAAEPDDVPGAVRFDRLSRATGRRAPC